MSIAFYYGPTGFACAWFYRHTMWAKPRDILMQGLIPLLGGIILLGIGSLALGAVLMIVWEVINPEHFSGVTHD
ncbi:hypothetical protein V3N99_15650 [Dermatophilaceae bacterium Soc4.6]